METTTHPSGINTTNPYYELNAIRDVDKFYGRSLLFRRFFEALANHQSVSLIGPRKIGKSSLLCCACVEKMQKRYPFVLNHHLFVHLDLREYLHKTIPDFFQEVCKEILLECQKIPTLSLQSNDQGEDRFSDLLEQIETSGFYLVLLLDSFDNIARNKHFGPDFLSFLRAHATKGRVSYVTATFAPLYELSHKGIVDSPFFNIFYPYTLGAFTEEEALELITQPAKEAGMAFTEEEIAWVRHYAGLHPFFIQRVCYVLFEEKRQPTNGKVNFEKHARTLAYRDLLPHFSDMWEHMSEEERLSLQDEAQQKDNQLRILPELSESAFFRQFVRNKCEVGLAEMSMDELEHALNQMNNPAKLGETSLRLMKAVTQRLNDEIPATASEKGKVIRDVLSEGLESMCGSGVRSDTAPDWLLYNILYYRYFRHHLKNNVIADRLGFTSDRQYYRARNKAIEALRNALLGME